MWQAFSKYRNAVVKKTDKYEIYISSEEAINQQINKPE